MNTTPNPCSAARARLGAAPIFTALLLTVVLLSGCARRYDVSLTGGEKLTGIRKPVLNKEKTYYTYKDSQGVTHLISAYRVTVIEPHQ